MASKSKRLLSGSFLGGTCLIVRTMIALFMTPLMVSSFGDHMYGLWMLVASFSGFYGILDLGLSSAVQRYMSKAIGTDDREEVNYVFNTSLMVFLVLGFIAFLAACILAYFAPVFVKNTSDVRLFRIIIILFSLNVVVGFPMRSFWGIFSSNLRYDLSVKLEIVNVLLKTALFVVFLKLGYGILAIAILNFSADMLWNISNVVFGLKIAPYIRFAKRYISLERLKKFFNYSIFSFISKIASNIKFNIDNYVISTFVGLSAVAVYSIGTRLIMYGLEMILKLLGIFLPVFSQYEARGDYDAIRQKFFFITKACAYLSIFVSTMLVFLGAPFIKRWVGPQFTESYTIILILVIPFLMRMLMVPINQLLYGVSKHKFLTWVNCGEAVCNLILSIILVRLFGIRGVAMGTAIPLFIVSFFILPVYAARILKVRVFKLYIEMLLPVVKGGVVLILLYALLRNIIASSYVRIIAFSIIYSASYGLIAFFGGLSDSERYQILNAIKVKT